MLEGDAAALVPRGGGPASAGAAQGGGAIGAAANGRGAATSERSPRVLRVVEEPGKEVQDAALGSPRRVAVKVTYKKV